MGFARVAVGGRSFHACTEDQVVEAVLSALDRGMGGRIITPNVDILRQARHDAAVRAFLADADIVVADGMPLIWASRLAGTPLPERVCGSSLIWSLARGLGGDGRSVYLLGGEPAGAPLPGPRRDHRSAYAAGFADAAAALGGGPVPRPAAPRPDGARRDGAVHGPRRDGAWRAARRLAQASPGLRIAGHHSPPFGFEREPAVLDETCRAVVEAKPDLVYVGVGFPKQERVISRLRAELPSTWFLGCGMAINFVAGDQVRAPGWMQRTGLEWAHRLASEPGRLAGRYVRHDAPYAVRLLAAACAARLRRP